MRGMMVINFKTYEEGTGRNALELAKIADSLAGGVEIILAVQPADIKSVAENVSIPVFSQHVDPVGYGKHTGWILPESVKQAGASGTLLNHSEKQMDFETLKKTVKRCKDVGLERIVCADSPENAGKIAELRPDYIAIEPPELIGGDVSVSKARPKVITECIERVKPFGIPVLCGAGIKNREDVRKAKELGAKGILVSSGVVKSKNPKESINDLLEGLR